MEEIVVKIGRRRYANIVEEIIHDTMGWYHTYYARTAVEAGVAQAIVAYMDREPIGVEVYYKVSLGEITMCNHYYVAVKPEQQGKHIGKILVTSVEELCWNQVDMLTATTTEDNYPARKLFRSLQYHEYTWEKLEQEIGYKNAYKLIQAACAHEDDLIHIKPTKIGIQQLISKLKQVKLRIPWKAWNEICYQPWLRLAHSSYKQH